MSQRNTSPLKRSTVRRTLQRFWGVTRTQPLIVFLSVFSSAGYIFLLTFANTYVMALIVDRVQAGPVAGDQVFEVFGPYILALVLVNLVGQILSKLQDYTVYKLEIAGNYHLARLCFDTLSNQSMTFHTSRFGGSLVSQTSRFMSGYTGLVDVTVYSLIPTITSVICTVAALAPVVPTFTVILVCIMAVYIAFVWLMYKRIMPLSAATSAAQNKLSGVLSDAVTNILAVKTCGREDFERDLFDAADRAARDAETVSMHAMMQRNFTTSGLIVITMAVVSVFVAGGNAWFGISAGSLVMIFTYTYNLTMRLNYVSSMMQRINRALGDAAEMTRVLDEPRLVADDPDAPELKVTEGAIDFEQLSFAYRDAAAGESVFDDLTLHVAAGQRVGLVGKSGSGKTTLTKLLLRLDDVQGGRVLVDGQDVSRCTQQSLRRQVAYVPQEALLFHRSIRENIAYGRPNATDEQIREAARLANATEFIDRLPRGFDTMVGERGVKLSGGQRQRVAIARAILTDAPILVLDEATSALDSESEALVQEALENLMRGRTSIVVAHRLSTEADGSYKPEKGLETLKKYATMFGLDRTSGIEISEATPSISDTDPERSSMGQGTHQFASVQLARYVTALANRGTVYDLSLIDKETDSQGNLVKDYSPAVASTLDFQTSTWDAVHQGMRQVVTNSSTKRVFDGLDVHVAGKTGTAQESQKRGNHAFFISFAPYENPEISVTVSIPNGYSSSNAAMVAKHVYRYFYGYASLDDILNSGALDASNERINGD